VECGGLINLAFALPDSGPLDPLSCRIQNVRNINNSYLLGCQFINPNARSIESIRYFVSSKFDRLRGPAENRILVIDENHEAIAKMVSVLESRQFDVVVAPGPIDGAFRLRLAEPCAVLISEDIPGIRGIDYARMIVRTPGLEDTVIYLYGGDDPELAELAKEAGLKGYLKPGTSPEQIARDLQKYLK
jgi:CheY-like chemotaxis protein